MSDLEQAARDYAGAVPKLGRAFDPARYGNVEIRLHEAAVAFAETGGWDTDLDAATAGRDYDVTVESAQTRAVKHGWLARGEWHLHPSDWPPVNCKWRVIAWRERPEPFGGDPDP